MDDAVDRPLFKRKKARPSRPREIDQSLEPVESNGGNTPMEEHEDSPMTLAVKLKNKHKARAKPQAKLSFGADDEGTGGEDFKVRKSELSRKMKLGGSGLASPMIARTPSVDDYNSKPSTPSYTAEYLTQLKASTAAPPIRVASSVGIQDTEMDNTVYNADELESLGVVDILDGVSFSSIHLHRQYKPEAELKSFGELGSQTLPSGSTIVDAKRERERRRIAGVTPQDGEDFISLSVAKRSEIVDTGPHPESRLMREDDDLGEGDDDDAEFTGAKERIALGKKAKKVEAGRRRAGMVEMIEDAEQDGDEEHREWENAQLRRNVGNENGRETSAPVKAVYKPAAIPMATTIPSLNTSIGSLTTSLTMLTASHANHTTAYGRLGEERDDLYVKEANLRKMMDEAESKRAWFKSFKDWVESVADFLDAKFPPLEKLEGEHTSLLAERHDMIKKRRDEDDEDDACLFLNLPPKPITGEQLDDMGRVVPQMVTQGPQALSRRARRSDRERRHIAQGKAPTDEDGFSTDASLPQSDADDFAEAMKSLRGRIASLLDDVKAKEFKDPRLAVGEKFDEWRKMYGESYVGAWGGLGAVNAWEFWARLELVGWDPLRDAKNLHSFRWFTDLYEYSRPKQPKDAEAMEEDDEDDEPPLGSDGDLVSSMVSTAVLPRLTAMVASGILDPYSMKHVRTMIEVAEELEICVPKDDPKFQALVQAVSHVYSTAIETTLDLVHPGLSYSTMTTFDPSMFPARKRFLLKRLKLLVVLLRWRKYAGDRAVSVSSSVHKLVKEVMWPIAQGGWDFSGRDIMQKVVRALPANLAIPEITAAVS
ncbi:hypothetical protein FRB98_002034 [Tulasnella sp. 332]|nr:hypothetical protein FRB98_002034 [Tulasnella sp. 332]